MKKLHYFLTAALVAVSGWQANAEGENKMVLNGENAATAIPINTITRLTFDGANMVIATADGKSQVDVLSLKSITFDLVDLSVESLVTADNGVTVSCNGGVVTAQAQNDLPLTVDVYALSGMRVMTANATGQVSVDLNPLTSGVYVIRVNNKTFKFTH